MEFDSNIIRQILLGRRDLFEHIVVKYQNLVYTICLGIVANSHDAENIAQETFLTAYNSLVDFRGDNIKSWLCRIAVNKSIDHKRRISRFILEELTDLVEQPSASLEESLLQKERKEKLIHILSELPEKYVSVIKAFYYRRFTVKEISQHMELSERTVETRLYRAKRLIRERWGNDEI